MTYCTVYGCRYPDTHLTSGHKCGTCGKFSHGRTECGNMFLINQLRHKSKNIFLPVDKYCQESTCNYRYNHTNMAHHCRICLERHFEVDCNNDNTNQTCDNYAIKEAKKILANHNGKIFGDVYAGMGCQWFVKRDSINSSISVFFMHTDSWGQYGPHCDDRQKLVNFLNGYVHYDTKQPFVLPSN